MTDGFLRHVGIGLSAVLVVDPARTAAQAPPSLTLKPPDAQLEAEFSGIRGVRELSGGLLLIADRADNRLVAADFRSGRISFLGRVGAGPVNTGLSRSSIRSVVTPP